MAIIDEQAAPCGGFAFVRALRSDDLFANMAIIVTSRANEAALTATALQCGADAALSKPYRQSALIKTISALRNRTIERSWDDLPATQRAALRGTVDVFNSLADTIATGIPPSFRHVIDACRPLVTSINNSDFRNILSAVNKHDNYTYVHSLRVATILTLFGRASGLDNAALLVLASGGLLHDVGKLAIPQGVLNKPGALDDDEMTLIKTHVTEAVGLLQTIPAIPQAVLAIAEQHHEKLDGTGYPNGLQGSQLNELARMATIVDVFSAMTDHRVYRPAMTADRALAIMSSEMKQQIDQQLLRVFRTILL
jgi:putative nucleotidyltransferase with HDIG domain